MTNSFKIVFLLFAVSLAVLGSAFAGETMKDNMQVTFMESVPSLTATYILEGKLLKIQGSVWLLEDMFGDHHRIQVGSETRVPLNTKHTGDSVHAVVRTNGHARIIQ